MSERPKPGECRMYNTLMAALVVLATLVPVIIFWWRTPSQRICDKAVVRGIDRLDDVLGPSTWRSRMSWEEFLLQCPEKCVLGQVFGSFNEGLQALGIGSAEAHAYGFVAPDRCFVAIADARLYKAWRIYGGCETFRDPSTLLRLARV